MVEESDFEISDNDIDEKKHDKLVENVLGLTKFQNVKKAVRTEPIQEISEFNLIKSLRRKNGSVQTTELAKALKDYKKHLATARQIKSLGKSKTLPTPLEKPQAEQIRRVLNYEKSRLLLDKWEAYVQANRAAASLVFPLDSVEKVKFEEKKSENYPSSWRIKSDLQKELERLEKEHLPPTPTVEIDESETFALTLAELKEKRKLAAKLRAHQRYKEAKARQQNKIKSKKYHRILKKEKIKQKLKEFEELQKSNPEEAAKKLEEIEKARAEERFSLRHKGTGQWAKNKQVRAKYDKESRQALAQQLSLSRELTQKLKATQSDSEEETEKEIRTSVDKNNPWISDIKPQKEVTDFFSGYRQYWEQHNKNIREGKIENIDEEKHEDIDKQKGTDNVEVQEISKMKKEKAKNKKAPKNVENEMLISKKNSKKIKKKGESNKKKVKLDRENSVSQPTSTSQWQVSNEATAKVPGDDVDEIFEHLEKNINSRLKQKYGAIKKITKQQSKSEKQFLEGKSKKRKIGSDLVMPTASKKQIIDEELLEQPRPLEENDSENTINKDLNNLKSIASSETDTTTNINPQKFLQVKQTSLQTAIPDILNTYEEEEEASNQRQIILEAFQDDDIAKDFETEKAKAVEEDTPKDVELSLPGWGQWGGTGTQLQKRKRKRLILKAPPAPLRKDENKGFLIVNEKAQSKIKPLLVNEIPFPFKSVKDYEASIRAPIGNTFVTETAFKKLIEPAVITKMGSIIEPVNQSLLTGKKSVNK